MNFEEFYEENKQAIIKWYEGETGRNAKMGPMRIEKIARALWDWGLSLEEVALENHNNDYLWNQRRNRTPLEKLSRVIGSNNSNLNGYVCLERWFLIPLFTPPPWK